MTNAGLTHTPGALPGIAEEWGFGPQLPGVKLQKKDVDKINNLWYYITIKEKEINKMKFKATYKKPNTPFALAMEGTLTLSKSERKLYTKDQIVEELKKIVSEELHNNSTNKGFYSTDYIKVELKNR